MVAGPVLGVVATLAAVGIGAANAQESEMPVLGEWTELPDYPIAVFEAQGELMECNGIMHHVVLGGFYNFPNVTYTSYRRDITDDANEWEEITAMPDEAAGGSTKPLTHMAQVVVEDVIYLAGGYEGAHAGPSAVNAFSYNCSSDEWTILPNLPEPRAGAGMVYHPDMDGLIFSGGGDRITPGGEDAIEDLDTLKHTDYGTTYLLRLNATDAGWQPFPKAELPDPRNHQGAVDTCGRFFWVGGQHLEDEIAGNRVTCNELLVDASAMSIQWKGIADLPLPLGHVSASTMPYKCGIVVVAGVTQKKERSNEVLWYDATKNTWQVFGAYPIKLATPICGIYEDRVYCATGGGKGMTKSYAASLTGPPAAPAGDDDPAADDGAAVGGDPAAGGDAAADDDQAGGDGGNPDTGNDGGAAAVDDSDKPAQ